MPAVHAQCSNTRGHHDTGPKHSTWQSINLSCRQIVGRQGTSKSIHPLLKAPLLAMAVQHVDSTAQHTCTYAWGRQRKPVYCSCRSGANVSCLSWSSCELCCIGSQPDVLKPCAFMTLTTALLISLYSTYAGTANDRVVVPCPVAAGPFSLHPDHTLC